MRHHIAHSIALACTLALAGPACADDVTFTGYAHGAESVNYALTSPNVPTSGSASAGGFATILSGGPSFVTYCVDLYQRIDFGVTYPEYSAPGTAHTFINERAYADLGRLYANVSGVDTSVEEAAFQIAVWEIAFETAAGPYSLSAGAATFSGGTAASSGALTLASSWLAGLGAGSGRSIYVLDSALHQDVIYSPAPEPSTLALTFTGMLATVQVARRRRARGA